MSSQVRVSKNTHQLLRSLSLDEGKSMHEIIEKAVENYRKKAFLEGLSDDFRRLRSNAKASQEHEEETAVWDSALLDGLENE